ncbi:MAG: lipoyl(octanoyl) transferase LipB [Alphaproteobacteria bacterium]|nr:lipoyl(octanoyl) transferase LipB [Alphaproteobacteria bacterium]
MSTLAWQWRGRLPYADALAEQRARREAIVAGRADEALWLLEHDPVVTTGKRAVPGLDVVGLAARGIPVVPTERGGLATWHGPGQLVAYFLIDVEGRRLGPRVLVDRIQDTVAAWLDGLGVAAAPRPGLPGVWAGRDKICAVGLHIHQGVSIHGLALNLCPDLAAFSLFSPCGVAPTDGGVTSVLALRGTAPSPEQAAASLGPALAVALGPVPPRRDLLPSP